MKIALIGYGKMGKTIEQIAVNRNHSIIAKIAADATKEDWMRALAEADVAIEFTNPKAAPSNVKKCLEGKLAVVSGSTGWHDKLAEMQQLCMEQEGAMLWASNFSVGVNIVFEINRKLAAIMAKQDGYNVSIEEVHHLQKKDAPSGTAISLAEQIVEATNHLTDWQLEEGERPLQIESVAQNLLPITALREDGIPGTHTITYSSHEDEIELKHTAKNRDGFALGAVLAAEFLVGKKGVFSMKDVLS